MPPSPLSWTGKGVNLSTGLFLYFTTCFQIPVAQGEHSARPEPEPEPGGMVKPRHQSHAVKARKTLLCVFRLAGREGSSLNGVAAVRVL